ncbi:hypothetical protein ACMGGA_03760 [Citrobacter sp. BNK-39]|uniref:hypothetical protein n=1 Tax=unclassified Citrobacter TaxID=2644389 RepID=UPI003B429137
MKHVVLHSGGHASALVAIEVARKYGTENMILLTHSITGIVEDSDIKRFRDEVAGFLGMEITYANHAKWDTATPVEVCVDAGAWKVGNGSVLCTNRLKTAPFDAWLKENDPDGRNIYYYGFEPSEPNRIQRRAGILGARGYKTEYPMIWTDRTIHSVEEVGIALPGTYSQFKHANCVGCLKAGWQHWYVVYCTRPDIWGAAKAGELEIGYAIHKDANGPVYLEDKEEFFADMKRAGVPPTEHIPPGKFWSMAKRAVKNQQIDLFTDGENSKPCECAA